MKARLDVAAVKQKPTNENGGLALETQGQPELRRVNELKKFSLFVAVSRPGKQRRQENVV